MRLQLTPIPCFMMLLVALLGANCTDKRPVGFVPPATSVEGKNVNEIRITETTQANAGGLFIGAGNIFADEFTDEGGETRSELHVTLSLYDEATDEERNVRLRAGAEVEMSGRTFQIKSIEAGAGNRGTVVLVESK